MRRATAYSYFTNAWLKEVQGQTWNANTGAWNTVTDVNYTYDKNGNCITRTNGINGADVLTTYAYDNRGQTVSISHGSLYDLSYIRDGAGNPLQISFSGSDFSDPYTSANTVQYSYDPASELTGEDWGFHNSGAWTSANNTTWTYDWVGNRDPSAGKYNPADEMNAGNGYTYDGQGNVKQDPAGVQYTYSPDNLLSNAGNATLTWDGSDQRVSLANGTSTWQCLYDPTAIAPSVLLAVNPNGAYTYSVCGPSGGPVASFDASSPQHVYYYHFDDLGSTVLVTDGSGNKLDTNTYGAWGNVLYTTNNLKPYQYVGQLAYHSFDSNEGMPSNLLQTGIRFYDPSTGRFTQTDLLGRDGETAYLYCGADPARHTDPLGLLYWGGGFPWVHFGKRPQKPNHSSGKSAIKQLIEAMLSLKSDRAEILLDIKNLINTKANAEQVLNDCQPFMDDAVKRQQDRGDGPPGITGTCASCCVSIARAMGSDPVAAACGLMCAKMFGCE